MKKLLKVMVILGVLAVLLMPNEKVIAELGVQGQEEKVDLKDPILPPEYR